MKHTPINNEPITKDEDVITTIDFDHDLSIDVISIDKHNHIDDTSLKNGFEAFIFRRDGTGDYTPIGVTWSTLPTIEEVLAEDFSDYIDEMI